MRKIILLEHVSLDGYVTDRNGGIDWILYDKELESYVRSLLGTVDTTIYGKTTFQMMENYWPKVLQNQDSEKSEHEYADWATKTLKVVVSKTLSHSDWANTKFINNNVVEEITKLKQEPGGDMMVLGSPTLAGFFIQHGLIDEYRLNINPVILGKGIPQFGDPQKKIDLKLADVKKLKSGVVAFHYTN